jgi:hypothetical protein
MDRIDSIKAKIEQIESLLAMIKSELETLSKKAEAKPKKARTDEPLPPDEQLRAEYENLYEQFIGTNSRAIEEFIKNKSKNYLKAFCKANNLPVDTTKVSKDGIVREVFQWMVQRKAITKKAT